MTFYCNLLGKKCKDKVTKKIGVCTEVRKTMYGGEKYLLETDGIDNFEPMWLDTFRLIDLEDEKEANEGKISAELIDEIKTKRGNAFGKALIV